MLVGYTRNQISKKLGIGNETLRHYEKLGIMPKPCRNDSNYRVYNEDDLTRLKFIKKLKELGFGLCEISSILNMLQNDRKENEEILKKKIASKILEIDNKMAYLVNLKEMLKYVQNYPNLGECDLLSFFIKPLDSVPKNRVYT